MKIDYLGRSSVSQREIQRCFNLLGFFQHLQYENTPMTTGQNQEVDSLQCIALSIALIYYFRLPTEAHNQQRNDHSIPTREELAEALRQTIPNFGQRIDQELERFVNRKNFHIPEGVAINQAVCCFYIFPFIRRSIVRFIHCRFANTSSLSSWVSSRGRLSVSSVYQVNRKRSRSRLFFKTFEDLNCLRQISANVCPRLIRSFVSVQSIRRRMTLQLSSIGPSNVNSSMNKIR